MQISCVFTVSVKGNGICFGNNNINPCLFELCFELEYLISSPNTPDEAEKKHL